MKERGEYGSDECHVNPTFMRIWPYYLSEAIFLDMLGNNFGDVISCGEDVYVFDEENEGFTAAMLDNQIDVAQDVTDLLLEYFVLPTKAFVESNAPPKLGLGILDLGALNEAVQDALEDEEDLLGAVDAWLPHRYEESFLADQSAENLVNMGYTKH